ncbi:hypothetical protein CRG98_037619 [Punica granatum]|uniref:Uncharacterized protein n=1 Tax=Punica granatum TaxID=22663 RepID=A0A2I0IDE2_PUNGR|nr:hypothetical protein CRG98_037619 [Punica granatum]
MAISSPRIWIVSGRTKLKLEIAQGTGERTTVGKIPTVQEVRVIVLSTREVRDDPILAQEARDDPMWRRKHGMTPCLHRKRAMTLVVFECGCKVVVLRIGLTLGTATRHVAWESENRGWFTRRGRHNSLLVVIL